MMIMRYDRSDCSCGSVDIICLCYVGGGLGLYFIY